MKKILLILLIVALAGSSVFGYQQWQVAQQQQEQKQKLSRVTIRAAKNLWPGQFWKEIAQEKGWFADAGLKVELIDTNVDYFASLEDLVNRKMDENAFTPFDFVLRNVQGANLVAILEPDISLGNDALISASSITSTTELKGKRVGVSRNTYTEYLLSVALEQEGMKLSDVQRVEVPVENAVSALRSGKVDAVFTYEPYSSEAIQDLGAHKLFDTSKVPGINPSIEVFTKEFVSEYPDVVQAYVNVWHKTTQFIIKNPDEAKNIISKIYNVPISDIDSALQGDKILTLEDNINNFAYTTEHGSLHGNFRAVNDFMVENGMTDKRLNSADYIDNRFIIEAFKQQ